MKAAANALQAAVNTRLTGDPTLAGLVTGVFDAAGAPVGQPFDYVVIGPIDSDADPMRTMGRNGEVVDLEMHVWTRGASMQKANTIVDRLHALLDTTLTVTGYALARVLPRSYTQAPDPQEDVQHAIALYQVWMQET